VRTLVVKKSSDLQALGNELLVSGLAAGRSKSALESLQALNPHVDFKRLAPGTVLLVPDAPDFKPSASKSIAGEGLGDLQDLVRNGLEAAGVRLETGRGLRAARRTEMTAVLKTAALKRAIQTDPLLGKQLEGAAKAARAEEQEDADAGKTLEAAMKGVQAELASLAKLLG